MLAIIIKHYLPNINLLQLKRTIHPREKKNQDKLNWIEKWNKNPMCIIYDSNKWLLMGKRKKNQPTTMVHGKDK